MTQSNLLWFLPSLANGCLSSPQAFQLLLLYAKSSHKLGTCVTTAVAVDSHINLSNFYTKLSNASLILLVVYSNSWF
ncbi:hypothetical protein POPTR_018G031850v4 [Populus trichocarpa]|uniref:Uncharacterized protein n=1 Tax=Populus trichocarpa TaxID=3694 RepID=A0ACC0RMQ9_POPTR|nr:hypothetical protein POPTR_018G031850v4 [Populus trichocarpa]